MVSLDLHRPAAAVTTPAVEARLGEPLVLVLRQLVTDLSLVLAEVSCPALLDEPVSVVAAPSASSPRTGGLLHLRQLPFAASSLLRGGHLLLAATQEAPLQTANALPALIAGLVEAERTRAQAEVTAAAALQMANVDALTGLGNRRAWVQALRLECSRASRGLGSLAVVVLDVDGLKAVNDLHGHAAGDEIISRTAAVLSRASRTTDVVCRLGGDEFGVAAPASDHEQAQQLVDRITAELAADGVQASVGVAVTTGCVNGPDELWQRADTAMYAAKRARAAR